MKILIVTQYFWPEKFIINDLAQGLIDKGYKVTVLTGKPNYPHGKFYSGYGFLKKRHEVYNGINIVRVPLFPRGSSNRLQLFLNYLSFAFFATLLGPFYCRDNYDLIFTYETSPITVGIPAIVLKKIKGALHLFWVQDLWPESIAAAGAINSRLLLQCVDYLVKWIYKSCDLILVQSRQFIQYIENQGIDPLKIEYFPNWAEELFENGDISEATLPEEMLTKGFKVMFAGNIGVAQDFPTILAAAENLKKLLPDVRWIIIGEGRMAGWVREQINKLGLSDTVFLMGARPMETMPYYYSLADVMLATLKRDTNFSMTIPSKIQSYMACGRPIVAALDGEGARVINESGAGLSCPSGDTEALAKVVETFYLMSDNDRLRMGQMGRDYYFNNFQRALLINRLEQKFMKVKLTNIACISGKSVHGIIKGKVDSDGE